MIATNHLDDEDIRGLLLCIRDVSASMRTEQALRDSEERYRLIVELAHEGIWVIDSNAYTTYANRAMAQMLGTTVAKLLGRSVFDFMDDEGRREGLAKLQGLAAGISEEFDFRLVTDDGRTLWTRVNTSPISHRDGTYKGAIGLVTDITERRELEQRLAREAQSDPLTGLANRNALFETVHACARTRASCAACCSPTSTTSNESTTCTATAPATTCSAPSRKRLGAAVRGCDTVARVGGDEFVVVTPALDTPDEAAAIARRIRSALLEPVRVCDDTIRVDVSIGVAIAVADGDDPDSLLARADDALYRAKRAGRGRVELAVRPSSRCA